MKSWNVSLYTNKKNLIKICLKRLMRLITQASNTNEPFAYDENNSGFEFVEMQGMHVCLKEENVIIHEVLQHNADSELMLNSIMTTTYFEFQRNKASKIDYIGCSSNYSRSKLCHCF